MKKTWHPTPSQTILAGFACMILIGAVLLNLPIASTSGESVGFLNALFTATSANCVTGLVVVNTASQWTWFGKIVILLLIQFGGLGFMTILTVGLLVTKRQISLRSRQAIQTSFNQDDIGGMVILVKKVIRFTILFEGIGALLLAICFFATTPMGLGESLVQGCFHAISAFCNAGFDNIGGDSLIPFQANLPINLIIMGLIISGGIGFIVLDETEKLIRNEKKQSLRHRLSHLSLQSKIVFTATSALLLSGTLLFLLLEWKNPATLGPMPVWQKVLAALFQSVTLRTAGFYTVPQNGLTEISQFFSCIFMMIGGSSASTAGGIKTVTFGVIIAAMISALKGRQHIVAFQRTLPLRLLQKALTVAGTMLVVVLTSTVLLHFTEQANAFPHSFLDLFFEVSSAAGTVGISTGLTPYLSSPGKLVLIACMFLGRLGPVTVVIALNSKLNQMVGGPEYIHERVIIG